MGNRVEELESKVASLQATVDGLTEELVETKERLRQLEAAADVSVDVASDDEEADPHAEVMDDDAASDDGVNSADDEKPEDEEESEADDSDIIVA